jgi:DNA-binding NtrC family response regulator
LLLDEVGDLSPFGQLKLLRFLEQREQARRAGQAHCELRVLCTTHEDLKRAVDDRRFRADLYFRLNVFPVRVPPLREHVEDVPDIARNVLAQRTPPVEISLDAAYALIAHSWPGNVRELENVLEYAALRSGGRAILPEHLPADLGARPAGKPPADERAELAEALARCGGSRTLAARSLGISRVTLWKRMKKYGVIRGGDE